jgi:hypothetical protein
MPDERDCRVRALPVRQTTRVRLRPAQAGCWFQCHRRGVRQTAGATTAVSTPKGLLVTDVLQTLRLQTAFVPAIC